MITKKRIQLMYRFYDFSSQVLLQLGKFLKQLSYKCFRVSTRVASMGMKYYRSVE